MTGKGSGTLVLSLDTELAWGSVHHQRRQPAREEEYARTRAAIKGLLALFDEYDIQATWAIVGHLFLSSCRPEGGRKHPEVLRPTYPWFTGDWFDGDPCGDVESAPFWYGPDIIEDILGCPVRQEIGCHGFSHMIIGDPGCSRDVFATELQAARAAAAPWGIPLRSFVFPRNAIDHVDVLAEQGFTAYRGNPAWWASSLPSMVQRGARLAEVCMPVAAPSQQPHWEHGIWDIPASSQYLHRSGWARHLPMGVRVRKAVATLHRACQEGGLFHLWFHPFNIASDPIPLIRGLRTILQEAARLRDEGILVNRTMADMAATMKAQSQVGRYAA